MKYKDENVENWIHGMALESKDKQMKTVRKIIKEMVDKYPNDMELGARVRRYIHWLYDGLKNYQHEYKDDDKWNM